MSRPPQFPPALPGNRAALWEITGAWRPYLKTVAADVLGDQLFGKFNPSDTVPAALVAAVQGISRFRD